ncbi:MAG: T9SS type A sorting domain-containing protein, partial [Bacteroidales bacterium]|nr:T9SS type A sorting domain-containing protein [Bacteroidales bacterium]
DANLQYTGLEPGSYVVKAFADGNQDAVCIAETPAILIEESPLLECEITSVQNASCATCDDGSATVIPIGGTPEYEYLWSDGQTTATAMNLLQGDYSVIITDANGCTSTCELTIDYEEESEENCTLTQGYYGNEGGLFCDELTTTELLDDYLLQEELVIGLAGSGSLTVGVEESDFVLMMLPGGGKSKVLTAEYNSTNYKTQEPFIYKKKKFTLTNTLLAQTLTLGLNLRIDGSTLSGLPINSMELVVYNIAECGGEAIGDPIYYALNESVYDELVAKYGNPTVGDLLEMANLSLADEYVPALYQPSLSDISDAVTTINEAFDECRIGSFSPPGDRSADELAGIINREENVSISAYPNPFMNSITIEFTMAEDTDAALEVYNMTGVKVASLYNGNVQANQTYSFNFSGIAHVNQGTFIYVLRAGKTVKMGRLVMMK